MSMLLTTFNNHRWQVSPVTRPRPAEPVIMWSVEVNDPIGGRGASLACLFKSRAAAEAIARALNAGSTPHEVGFAVKHLLDQ